MDYNVVVVAGRLAAPPEFRKFKSGSSLLRILITVRSDSPRRRVDVIPVTLWDPGLDHDLRKAAVGTGVWAAGSVQRRFWTAETKRKSRIEVVAQHIQLAPDDIVPDAVMDGFVAVDGSG